MKTEEAALTLRRSIYVVAYIKQTKKSTTVLRDQETRR
jgi:hypothetical protein